MTGLVAAPVLLGATLGAGTASAQPFQIGPLYRAESSGESGQYICNKAQALERSSQSIVLVTCSFDPQADVWYRIVVNPYNWGLSF